MDRACGNFTDPAAADLVAHPGRRPPAASGLVVVLIILGLCLATPAIARELSFEQRVAAQREIDRVYYSHQLGATLPFEQAVPLAATEAKVRASLQESLLLETDYDTPLTAEAFARELQRIERDTRYPERLREIYAALGNDSFARPGVPGQAGPGGQSGPPILRCRRADSRPCRARELRELVERLRAHARPLKGPPCRG